MYSSITVANHFLRKGWAEHIPITPMKILKLVYVAHGWHLGWKEKPLIYDPIMAWRYGPVIPNLYHEVKEYRSRGITSKIRSAFESVYKQRLDDDTASFLNMIWEHYKSFTAFEMSSLTHQKGSPWDRVREKTTNAALRTRSIAISDTIIKDYYENKINSALDQPTSAS